MLFHGLTPLVDVTFGWRFTLRGGIDILETQLPAETIFCGSQCSSCGPCLLFVLWLLLIDLKWPLQCCCWWWCCHRCGCGCCEQQMMLGASEATAHPRTAKPGLRGGIPVCPSHSPMADHPGLAPQLAGFSKWLSSQAGTLFRDPQRHPSLSEPENPLPHSCLWSERLLWTNYLLDCVGFQSVRTTLFVMLGMRAKIISWAWLKSSTTPLMTHNAY